MQQYCFVDNNGISQPQSLPRNWRNISNFNALEPARLAEYGWFQFVPAIQPVFDPASQRVESQLQFDGFQVKQAWTVVALTQAEQIAFATARITDIGNKIGSFLDGQVAAKQYDSVLSATSWNLSNITAYKTEAAQATAYRDTIWQAFGVLVAGVQAGTTPLPTVDGWFASLPVLWPPPPPPPNNGNGTGNGTLG